MDKRSAQLIVLPSFFIGLSVLIDLAGILVLVIWMYYAVYFLYAPLWLFRYFPAGPDVVDAGGGGV